MKNTLLLLFCVLLLGTIGCDKKDAKAPVAPAAVATAIPAGNPEIGKELITTRGCVACHSIDGTKKIGPSFKNLIGQEKTVVTDGQERQITVDDAYLQQAIENPNTDVVKGYNPLMPPYPGDASEIPDVIAYLKTL